MREEKGEVIRTDGKRSVQVFNDRFNERDEVSLSICRNGHQTTVICIDLEMLSWLKEAIDEFNERKTT